MRAVKAVLALLGALLTAAPAFAVPDRPDPAGMAPAEVTALQRQLTDARCYTGPLDGRPSPALTKALAACPDPRPVLRIETGTHVSIIKRVAADANCRLVATGSDDKTVRLWAMPEGRLIRTQRLPIGEGDGGKIYAVAVSPDGSLIAAGGSDAAYEALGDIGVYLFDTATGTRTRRLGAFEHLINHIAFSPDGKRLAVALQSGLGVRVLDVATGRELMADRDFSGKGSYAAAFGPDGSLYAAGFDGTLRRYGSDLKTIGKVNTLGGKQPYSLAINESGRIAVGYYDTSAVEIYDAGSLRRFETADTGNVGNGNLNSVMWVGGGSHLVAGGRLKQDDRFPVLNFDYNGRRIRSDAANFNTPVASLAPCQNEAAFSTTESAFGLLHADGTAQTIAHPRAADMRAKLGAALTLSHDGMQVRFGLGLGDDRPVIFDLTRADLRDAPTLPADFVQADTTRLPVSNWKYSNRPRLDGRTIALDPNEIVRSMAVRPGRTGFVLGTEWSLRAHDAAGRERWQMRGPGVVSGVDFAPGRDLIVAAYGDGTIRWHRWSDGRELLALFVNKDTRAWVAWTPTGYYTASPGGEDLIGWQVNRGWEQPADFFPASKFRDQYARPDVVERVLATLDEAEAVRQANAARPGKAAEAVPVNERLPPVLSILSPAPGAGVDGESVRIDYLVRSPSGLPVDAVEALVDGRPAGGERGLARLDVEQVALRDCLAGTRGLGRVEGGLQGCRGALTLRLPPGAHEVGLFARVGDRAGEVAKIRLTRAAAATGAELLKPKLYALVVGISAYANPGYRLGFAAKDAADFAAALQNQKGGLYGDVTVRALADGEASAQAIRKGLDWLTKQVTSRDVGLVYLAGHGMLDARERFYFLAADSDAEQLRATAVPREDIQDALDSLAGKALLFLDACHSGAVAGAAGRRGGVDINAVVNEFARSERGVVAFTASTGRQVSQENSAWGNGAFTKAVVEGLGRPGQKAKADLLGNGTVTASQLDAYVRERVKQLTGGEQSPIMIRPATVPDFAFALAR